MDDTVRKELSHEFIDWIETARVRVQSGHSLFGPSTLPRAMKCTGSVRLCIENEAKSVDTEFTIEGSCGHLLGERCLKENVAASFYEGKELTLERGEKSIAFTPDAEMCRYVQDYIDWCNELPGEHFVETHVSLTKYMPLKDQGGTADHAAIFDDTLVVTDLKYGQGEIIFAKDNEQGLAYALGFYEEWAWAYDIKKVIIRICQPRLAHYDVWETTVGELQIFAQRMFAKVKEAIGPDAKLVPGDKQCRFCPMSGRCAAQATYIHSLVKGDFDSFDDPQDYAPAMTMEQVAVCLANSKMVANWLKALKKQAFDAINRGIEVPGWKLVSGKSNRQWIDEKKAAEWLKQHKLAASVIFEKTLISPAQAEKNFKGDEKKAIAALVRKPPGRPTLALESDPRPRLATVAGEFEDFDEEDDEPIDDGLGD